MNEKYLSQLMIKKKEIPTTVAIAIEAVTGYSHKWILTGKGEMVLDQIPGGMTPDEHRMVLVYRAYPKEAREMLMKLLTVMLK